MKFTDGTPLDAAAVAYNFDQFENTDLNGTAKVSIDPYYKSAEAIDPTHVAIHLTQPYPQFLTLITQGYFGIQSPTALKTRSKEENCEKPIGSGAFTVEQWKKGQEVIFKKNPNYTSWPSTAKHKGPAYVDEIKWKFVPDGVSRYASLTTGQSDVIYEVPTVNWKDAQSRFSNTIRYITPGKPVSFYLNTKAGVFTDKLVRQAFAYGADRKGAVEAGFHGVIPYEGNPSVSQSTPDYNDAAAKAYAYDPDKASELLDQAGWTEGLRRRPHQGRQAADRQARVRRRLHLHLRGSHRAPGPAGAVEEGRLRRQARPGHDGRAVGRQVLRPVDLRRHAVVLDEPEPGHPLDRLAAEHRQGPQRQQPVVLQQRPAVAGDPVGEHADRPGQGARRSTSRRSRSSRTTRPASVSTPRTRSSRWPTTSRTSGSRRARASRSSPTPTS